MSGDTSLHADVGHLAARFVAGAIPHAEWTHLAHLMVGSWHVDRYGREEALARLRVGIRRLNDRHGTPNSLTSGYHETVTRAYVHLLGELLDRCPADMPLHERVAGIISGPLADNNVLFRFYSRERLMSPVARSEWVEPDIAPLQLPLVAR